MRQNYSTRNFVPQPKMGKPNVSQQPDVEQDEQPALQGAMTGITKALQGKKSKAPPQIQNIVNAMRKRKQKMMKPGGNY